MQPTAESAPPNKLFHSIIFKAAARAVRKPRSGITSRRESLVEEPKLWPRPSACLKHLDALKILSCLYQALSHGLLSCPQGHAGIIILLVGLLGALGVADLALEVIVVLGLWETINKRVRSF